jgi:hypothetical protein
MIQIKLDELFLEFRSRYFPLMISASRRCGAQNLYISPTLGDNSKGSKYFPTIANAIDRQLAAVPG